MVKRDFIVLTLANGKKKSIIKTNHIGFAMEMEESFESEEKVCFTRIFPTEITISEESNWIDVLETPDEIIKKIFK